MTEESDGTGEPDDGREGHAPGRRGRRRKPLPGAVGKHKPAQLDRYGRAVRTALRDNATAYGFSLSVTAAYGLVSGAQGPASPLETVTFAVTGAAAFLLVGLAALLGVRPERLGEDEREQTLSGGLDVLSVIAAVLTAYALSRVPGFAAWPLTGVGTVTVYLLVGALDVLLARVAARHTYMGEPD
ncbi:hypothetical protein [Streptomyces sp. JJ36]|uniref:hypothetical protein n=1 Tax=Streptomyces sp. JJ36 TaxID=2736645 RepID=UPI001F283389|nr:hypothetical protein [Streptomyces sp. JJ36]MCF6522679.1 hypothetical protein [Streptomyces sp. JJ36]